MDKYRVALEADERADLERLVSAGKAAARKLTHARILLLADDALGPGQTDDDIVAALAVGPQTIARIRQQFVTQGLAAAIDRKAQPFRPDKVKIKGDIEQKLIRLACVEFPTKSGQGVNGYSVCSYSAGETYPSDECRRVVL